MMNEAACRVCGCTQHAACVDDQAGPCWWVEPDLCSHCVQFVDAARELDQEELLTIAAMMLHQQADQDQDAQEEEEARQRLRRIEREVRWMMLPGHVGHEIHVAVVGTIEIFEKNPKANYCHALGERLGPRISSIDEAQATVIAEVVHAASTTRRQDYADRVAEAQANGWVVYAMGTPVHQTVDTGLTLKAAGIEWISMSYEFIEGGWEYHTVTLNGPVPDELPPGIMRHKPTKESPQ